MPHNVLDNPRFDEGLDDDWTATGAILRSDGYPRSPCVELEAGEQISQAEQLSEDQLHTLHYFYKLATGATLTVSYGAISQTHTGGALDVWREGVLPFALTASANDSVTFAASGGTVLVDSISLMGGALPITRAQIATRVAIELGGLATDQSLSTTASSDGPEGDYSLAVDNALRAVGATNLWGDPDVVRLEPGSINSVIEEAIDAMLHRLRRTYALKSDVSLGPRRESLSQISRAIGEQLNQGPGTVAVRRLRHRAEDFEL